MSEAWRSAPRYEGIYDVSSYGNVRRIAYFDNASIVHHGQNLYKNMKQVISKFGYPRIKLMNHGKPRIELVHRLVAKAFVDNNENKPCVNHIDGNKENNHFTNLEWCTHSENIRHSDRLGLRNMKNKKGSKKTGQFDKNGNLLNEFPSGHEASRQTGIAQSHIQACCKGREKTASGFVWKYL